MKNFFESLISILYSDNNEESRELNFNLTKPTKYSKMLFDFIKVAGITHRYKNVLKFVNGYNQTLELQREPTNKFDKNAIKVYGIFVDKKSNKKYVLHIGYIPSENAKIIKNINPLYGHLEKIYLPTKSKYAGIRFSVWTMK